MGAGGEGGGGVVTGVVVGVGGGVWGCGPSRLCPPRYCPELS